MATLDLHLENILKQAIAEARIVGHFQYGHNLLQSPVQIDEIFGMINSIIKKVLDEINDVIPDINLAPYADGKVDPSRANLCWIQLKRNYYGLILNTHIGISYRVFTDDDIQSLLLNGQCSSWYLVSKIQNLSYLVATENSSSSDSTIKYFKSLIIDIVERFFADHEASSIYHPAGKVNANNLDKIISRAQIQNQSSVIPAGESTKSKDGVRSKSFIKTQNGDICWQSVSNLPLYFIDYSNVSMIINSEYFNERADVEAFLQSTFEKRNGKDSKPNVFCFYANYNFDTPYINLDYIIESQLQGYIEVEFSDGEDRKIYPDTQPMVLIKGKNNVTFVVIIKLDNDITKKVDAIKMTDKSPNNLKMCISCTGVYKEYDKDE